MNANAGKIVEIIGAVVDVEFPRHVVPKIYDALKVEKENLVLEVQQQLGDGIVRTIAMGSTDGLRRGSRPLLLCPRAGPPARRRRRSSLP